MKLPPDIIIIRGAPGTGKSQSAKNLAKNFPKGVLLEVDKIRQMVISVEWTNQDEHLNMIMVSSKLITEFLKLNYSPVIVVDTFSGDKIQRFIDAINLTNPNISLIVFGLFANESELEMRITERSNSEFKDFSICKKLNVDIWKWKFENEHMIDTTGLEAAQTAEIMLNFIVKE